MAIKKEIEKKHFDSHYNPLEVEIKGSGFGIVVDKSKAPLDNKLRITVFPSFSRLNHIPGKPNRESNCEILYDKNGEYIFKRI